MLNANSAFGSGTTLTSLPLNDKTRMTDLEYRASLVIRSGLPHECLLTTRDKCECGKCDNLSHPHENFYHLLACEKVDQHTLSH